jgi:hypothetical protein
VLIDRVLADVVVSRWPAGQRFCWLACLFIAAGSPSGDALADEAGRPLSRRDLARILRVDAGTVDRFIERARSSGRLLTRDGLLVVPEITSLLNRTAESTSLNGHEAVEPGVEAGSVVHKRRAGPDQDVAPVTRDASHVRTMKSSPQARTKCSRARGSAPAGLLQDHDQGSAGEGPARLLWDLPADLLEQRGEPSRLVELDALEELLETVVVSNPEARRRLVATVLAFRAEGLPHAVFETAIDRLGRRRRRGELRNEAGYLVRTLRGLRDEERARVG